MQAPLHSATSIEAIQHADVVFSCVDGHGARLILNRFAYAHLAVVVDLAVLVAVSARVWRSTSESPGSALALRVCCAADVSTLRKRTPRTSTLKRVNGWLVKATSRPPRPRSRRWSP